jgi:hypothetical protein
MKGAYDDLGEKRKNVVRERRKLANEAFEKAKSLINDGAQANCVLAQPDACRRA